MALLRTQGECLKILREQITGVLGPPGEDQFRKGLTQLDGELLLQDDVHPVLRLPELTRAMDYEAIDPIDLESALSVVGLPEDLEHYSWAYPLYRACIEPADPHACSPDEMARFAKDWIVALLNRVPGLERSQIPRVAEAALQPWIRARAGLLQKRRLAAV